MATLDERYQQNALWEGDFLFFYFLWEGDFGVDTWKMKGGWQKLKVKNIVRWGKSEDKDLGLEEGRLLDAQKEDTLAW